jgi:hypothetical protein
VDKSVEQLNSAIDRRLGQLELFLEKLPFVHESRYVKVLTDAFNQITNTGDVLSLWNGIVRAYTRIGLAVESQQVIRIKVKELLPNLEAITYGLKKAIDTIFDELNEIDVPENLPADSLLRSGSRLLMDLLRTFSFYSIIRKQCDTDSLELLTVPLLNRELKNAFDELTQSQLHYLRQILPDAKELDTSSSVRGIHDFPVSDVEGRLRSLEEELGFHLPRSQKERIREMSRRDQESTIVKIRNELGPAVKRQFVELSAQEEKDVKVLEDVEKDISDLQEEIELIRQDGEQLEHEFRALRDHPPISVEEAEKEFEPVPELPIEPTRPEFKQYNNNKKEYAKAVAEYQIAQDEYFALVQEHDFVVQNNKFLKEQLIQEEADRIQLANRKHEQLRELARGLHDATVELRKKEEERDRILRAPKLKEESSKHLKPALQAVVDAWSKKVKKNRRENRQERWADYPESESDEDREEASRRLLQDDLKVEEYEGDGRMRPRGKALLNDHYGIQQVAPKDKELFDYDDTRNEHYFSRPY